VPPPPPDAPLISMQEAYDPRSICFACGPSSETGLRLQSFRAVEGGLVGEVRVPEQYVELPGVVSSGILSALAACHANWASSVALMDRSVLARPPLLQTSRIALEYARDCSAAPGQLLRITSRVLAIADAVEPFTVGACRLLLLTSLILTCFCCSDVAVRLATAEGEELATGTASFVKIGAARSL